jgi:hypothetical protein
MISYIFIFISLFHGNVATNFHGSANNCTHSDQNLLYLQNKICISLGGCQNVTNITAYGDWPSQVTYYYKLLELLEEESTCLHTLQALRTIKWLKNTNTTTSEWWYTWNIFQVQYYDMPRLPNTRIESPATLGRKCWGFNYLKQVWNQKNNFNITFKNRLMKRLSTFDMETFYNAYEYSISLTIPLCNQVMANCFYNSTYLPKKYNGTCPDKIGAFYVGYQWENYGGGNDIINRQKVDYTFPLYHQTKEFQQSIGFAVNVTLNEII